MTIDNNANPTPTGFSFENVHRNAVIENLAKATNANSNPEDHGTTSAASILPMARKTGTTIAGLVFGNGVVLGADTRATNDTEVAEKNCEKIHFLAPNIYCCGAGTAADTEQTTDMVRSNLDLLRLQMHGEQSRVITACTHLKRYLFKYQGHISAALVLGGCDIQGPHIYQIYPHGSTGKLPYTTMGSGSLAAMSVFESSWRSDMSEQDAIALVQRAIGAGIFNDLGSGSNCDICVIRLDSTVSYHRNMVTPNELTPLRSQVQHSQRFNLPRGVTPVLTEKFDLHPPTMMEQFASLEATDEAGAGGATEMEVEG